MQPNSIKDQNLIANTNTTIENKQKPLENVQSSVNNQGLDDAQTIQTGSNSNTNSMMNIKPPTNFPIQNQNIQNSNNTQQNASLLQPNPMPFFNNGNFPPGQSFFPNNNNITNANIQQPGLNLNQPQNNGVGFFQQNNMNLQPNQSQDLQFGMGFQRLPQHQFGQTSFGAPSFNPQNVAATATIKKQAEGHLFGQLSNPNTGNPGNSNNSGMMTFSSLASSGANTGFLGDSSRGGGSLWPTSNTTSLNPQGFSTSFMMARK